MNGERTRVTKISSETEKRVARVYKDAARTQGILRIDVLPMWFNSGMVPVGDYRSSLFSLPSYASELDRWRPVPDDRGKSNGKLELAVQTSRSASTRHALTVDTTNQHAILHVVARDHKGSPTLEIRLSYGTVDGAYIARQWETAAYGGNGNLLIHEAIEVKEFSKTCQFPDELFTFPQADDD